MDRRSNGKASSGDFPQLCPLASRPFIRALKSADSLVSTITFITDHIVDFCFAESSSGALQPPRFIRSAKVQLSFVVFCTSKFLASHSFVSEHHEFVSASLRLCLSALHRPDCLGLSISGGRTLKIYTPNQLILASKVSGCQFTLEV